MSYEDILTTHTQTHTHTHTHTHQGTKITRNRLTDFCTKLLVTSLIHVLAFL